MSCVLFHGNDYFSMSRSLSALKLQLEQSNVDVSDMKAGTDCLDAARGSVFFQSKRAIIIRNLTTDSLTLCEQLIPLADDDLTIVFVVEKKLPKSSRLLKFLNTVCRVELFAKPDKAYKLEEHAISFLLKEAKTAGIPFENKSFAKAIVQRCGTDLGTLRWEFFKASVLAKSQDRKKITIADIRGTICPIEQIGPFGMLSALESKNSSLFLRAAKRCHATSGRDPTMGAIAMMYPTIMNWMCVADLYKKGQSPSEISQKLKVSPWLVGKMIKPANQWGKEGCINILGVLSDAENAIKTGSSFPWVVLVSGLLRELSK